MERFLNIKFFRGIIRFLILSGLICVTYLSGVYSVKYRQNQEENKSTITTIAVVNADIGTIVDGKKKNYASELMGYPDTNFESAGLEEAREGIAGNRYAAYILIPSTFSESIESVNKEPVKAQLTYALNDNLRQDVQIKVVNDIHNFILNMSTNVSYIYVDAILQEMHAVQDDSGTIMKNDVEDMESIIAVQTAELIKEVKYDPLKIVETEIGYMDLSDDYEKVDAAVDEIYETYELNMEEAEAEFMTIKESGVAVDEQVAEVAETFAEVDILMDAEENCVYEDGMENLNNLADEFSEEVNAGKLTAKERLGFREGDEEPEPEPELEEGEVRVYISKNDLLEQTDAQVERLKAVRSTLLEEKENGEGEGNNEIGSREGEDEEILIPEVELAEAIADLETLKQQIEEYYENGIRVINRIPDASEFASKADQVIHEDIEAPIMDEVDAESEKVSSAINTMQEAIQEYVIALDEYDAMSYLDREKIYEYLSSLSDVINDMEAEIMEQDNAYMEYIYEVIETTDSNVEMLQENLDAAYEETKGNIDHTMEDFKENRTGINALNVFLLNDITGKLPYTRLGNLEYTQVYDFIAQPVLSNDVSVRKSSITVTSVNLDRMDLICLVIGIIALIIIDIAVWLIHKRMKNKKEDGEGGELWQME